MSNYWKWRCEQCGREFILSLERLPDPCHRCGGCWFIKVGEAERDEQGEAS
jgi:DNA-directed RNA polymerase subunit RPC12/RpoP